MNPNQLTPKELAQVAAIRAKRFGNPEGLKPTGLDEEVISPFQLKKNVLESFSDNLQTDWNSFRLQDIPNKFGEALQDSLDSVSQALDVVRPVITVIKSAIEVLLTFVDIGLDLITDAFQAAILLLEAIVDIFNTTGVFYTHYVPKNQKMLKSTPQVLDIIAKSYDDEFDSQRPISRSRSDTQLFVGMLPTAPNWNSLIPIIKELSKLFDFSGAYLKPTVFNRSNYPDNIIKRGILEYPNWNSGTLRNLKFAREITDSLNGIISNLRTSQSKTQAIASLLSSIDQRLVVIESKVNQILNVLEALINISLLPVNTLTIYGPGDIDAVKGSIRSASYLETYPFQSPDKKDFPKADVCAAFCMHFVLSSGKALDFVRTLFAIKEKAKSKFKEDLPEATTRFDKSRDNFSRTYSDSKEKFNVIWNAPTGGQGED